MVSGRTNQESRRRRRGTVYPLAPSPHLHAYVSLFPTCAVTWRTSVRLCLSLNPRARFPIGRGGNLPSRVASLFSLHSTEMPRSISLYAEGSLGVTRTRPTRGGRSQTSCSDSSLVGEAFSVDTRSLAMSLCDATLSRPLVSSASCEDRDIRIIARLIGCEGGY